MASKQTQGSIAVSPQPADDFKLIKGIGQVIADRLNEAGIRTFKQLAALSPTTLVSQVSGLSAKQIARQDWIGQARKLARTKPRPKSKKKESIAPTLRQHYENFTVEFLLDEKNAVRRVRAVHVQSGDAKTWTGWESGQLNDFLAQHTEASISAAKITNREILDSPRQLLESAIGGSDPGKIKESSTAPQFSLATKAVKSANKGIEFGSQFQEAINLTGTLRVQDLKVIPIGSNIPLLSLHKGQPYLLRLTLDLSYVDAPSDVSLLYKANIFVKQFGGKTYLVNEVISNYKLSDKMTLGVLGPVLPPGLYQLAVFVKLTSDETSSGLTALLKGDLIQVF